MFDMKKFSIFLSEKRKNKNITQGQLADMVGVSHQAVSKWERGESMPEISKLASLSDAISVPTDEILAAMHNDEESDDCAEKYLDDRYFALLDKTLVGDVYELAPHLSPETLSKAITEIVVSKGSEIASVLFQFADEKVLSQVAERVFEMECTKGRAHLMPYLSEKTLTKVVLNKYANGEIKVLASLMPMIKNEKVADMVFEISVDKYDGTWNLLRPYISNVPDSVLIKHGIKIAVRVGPGCFNSWWHLLGQKNSAEILGGYCRHFMFNRQSIRDVSKFYSHCDGEILDNYFMQAILSGVEVQNFVPVYALLSDKTKELLVSKGIDTESCLKYSFENSQNNISNTFLNVYCKNNSRMGADGDDLATRIEELEETVEYLEQLVLDLKGKIEARES